LEKNEPYIQEVEAAKRASVLQLLFKCARLANELALDHVRKATGMAWRQAHTNLFPHIDHDGTRLTDLAKRVGISKQAVGQLVEELEAMGALQRVPDPSDGRAKLIRFKREGRGSIMAGLTILDEVAHDLTASIGAPRMDQLLSILQDLEGALVTRSRDRSTARAQ